MRILLCVALLFLYAETAVAQTLPSWGNPLEIPPTEPFDHVDESPGTPEDPDPVPVDGGLGLLGLAGAAYAWKRLRKPSSPDANLP